MIGPSSIVAVAVADKHKLRTKDSSGISRWFFDELEKKVDGVLQVA